MIKYLIFSILLLATIKAEVCTEPQKTLYMSFPALSQRDSISNLFAQIDKKMTPLSNNHSDSSLSATFQLTNIKPQFYYNDHHQIEQYISKYQANVTLGVIDVASTFNYSISYQSTAKKGTIKARGFLDPSYFTKNLTLFNGMLAWKSDIVNQLTFSQYFNIQRVTPNITEDELNIILKMINNQIGSVRIKDQIINQINQQYAKTLQDHLNHQNLISSQNILYKYRDILLQFQHFPKDFQLSNDETKGLEVFFKFGLQSNNQICTVLPKKFDQQSYGGVQQVYSLNSIKSMLNQAISKGLFDVTLNQSWQTPGFQFYMGDLGNFVDYANYQKASDKFSISCVCDRSVIQKLKLSAYDAKHLYLFVPMKCTAIYSQRSILEVSFGMTSTIKLVGAQQSIRVVVSTIGVYGGDFKSLDPNYIVTDVYAAKYSIQAILKGLLNKTVFGNGFPVLKRKYPSLDILQDRIILFDPSQM